MKLKKLKVCNNCESNCNYAKDKESTFDVDGILYCDHEQKNSCSGDCKVEIKVPAEWLDDEVKNHGFTCLDDFYNEYLYSDSNKILTQAIANNKIIQISPIIGCINKEKK